MAVQDPSISGVPGRYATALFELAQESKSIDKIGGDLERFAALLDGSEDLARLVRSPVFSAEDQGRAISRVLAKAKISGLAANFIALVTENRRLFAVREMISAYHKLVAIDRGEVSAEVTSAEKLTTAQKTKLKAALKAQVGRDVIVEEKVDHTILGGLIVKVGSRMVDNSLRTKLQNLKIAMKEVG